MASTASELPQFKGRPGWEFTDISGLDLAAYQVVTGPQAAAPDVSGALFAVESQQALPDGVIVTTIGEAAREHAELLRRHLGTVVTADDIFTMLNESAEYRDGTFVYVPRGVALDQPISLTTVQARTGTLLHQRTLIVLEEGAQAEVWEQYLSAADDLDGVYRRGEIYLRWLQRLSSAAFGTSVGRFLTLFLVLPFGVIVLF